MLAAMRNSITIITPGKITPPQNGLPPASVISGRDREAVIYGSVDAYSAGGL